MDQEIKKLLPETFEYQIQSIDGSKNNFKAVIRLKCQNETELSNWKAAFELKSKSHWIILETFPNV